MIIQSVMATASTMSIRIMSYNMHGFNQGYLAFDDLIATNCYDVLFLQEHWLTPANLSAFDNHFTDYFSVGCSAMIKNVECGMLHGRPFGGVISLVNNTKIVQCGDCYVIIKIDNLLLINVYFPCSGTKDRIVLCEEMLAEISSWCESFYMC